jgi:hypothetical protein
MDNEWPFKAPKNLGVFTTHKIMNKQEPILRVTHDLAGGDWQFLPGYDLDDIEPALVCLEHIVDSDPSLRELSNLKLHWEAERQTVNDSWISTPRYTLDYDNLINESIVFLNKAQESLKNDYRISEWESWDYDPEEATLTFSHKGKIAIIAKIQFIGSYSDITNTWLWSWANSSILEKVRADLMFFGDFGEENGFEKISEAKWEADIRDAWDMSAITAYLLDGMGVYKAPSSNGPAFLLITDIKENHIDEF